MGLLFQHIKVDNQLSIQLVVRGTPDAIVGSGLRSIPISVLLELQRDAKMAEFRLSMVQAECRTHCTPSSLAPAHDTAKHASMD